MYPVLHADPEAAAAGEGRLGPLRCGLCPELSEAPRSLCPRSSRNPLCRPILGVPRKTWKIISFGIALAGPRVTPVREDQWEDGAGAAPRPPHPVPHPNPAGRGERAPLAPCPDPG